MHGLNDVMNNSVRPAWCDGEMAVDMEAVRRAFLTQSLKLS